MNTLIDNHDTGRGTLHHRPNPRDDAFDDVSPEAPRDRELTLGTATILALFFALAILCAAFFAFGYSLGSKHTAPSAASTAAAPILDPLRGAAKPSPGSPATPAAKAPPAAPIETVAVPAAPAPVLVRPAPARNAEPATQDSAEPIPSGTAGPIVQVAAVSHQEDAELIASTLKRRGYAVVIRNEPQDKLLHLQLGPFANKKDAEAMRQRLLADGFNAYIK